MPPKKEKDYTTITLPRKDYDKLVKFKRDLEKRDNFEWVTALGLGAFVGFMIGMAADQANAPIVTCSCGQRITLNAWGGQEFSCPNCRRKYPQVTQANIRR